GVWTRLSQGHSRAVAARQADADRRRYARQCRRLDSRRGRRRGCRICITRRPCDRRGQLFSPRSQRPPHRRERGGGTTELMMAPKIVTFGEIMLRLSPPGFERLLQSPSLVATFGGGEANVAASLAGFGLPAAFVT